MKNLTDFRKTVENGVDPRLKLHQRNLPGFGIGTKRHFHINNWNVLPRCKDQAWWQQLTFQCQHLRFYAFPILNYPHMDSNIPTKLAYSVYVSTGELW